LQAFDIKNRILFIIDTGSVVSAIRATPRDKSKAPQNKVLYSATANEIHTFGECELDVNFNTSQNYSWNFTKTDLDFSIIGLDFLSAHKLTVDSYNRCLVDKVNNSIIPLRAISANSPKLCCILPEQSEFHQILANYPNILNPPHRFERTDHGIEHAIPTNGKIVKNKLRRVSPETQKIIDQQINDWLKDGIISRSASPYSSCLHVVQRKSGKPRVCVDYRNLNATSVLESYPIPHIQSVMDNLYGSKVFSVLDLKSAYFNVPIRKEDRQKTAIIVKSGCYEFNYLPFGLKSAPATFMRFIHEVLYSQVPELRKHTEIYLDDILIHTPDHNSHKQILEKVCQCLNKFNLGINLSKCVLGKSSLNYLGFKISADGYTATDDKIKAINDFPLPQNLRQLSRFCGMINFYHKAIEKCSSLLKPLYDILNANKKKPKSFAILWTSEQKTNFEKIKAVLARVTMLSFPIPFAQTFLATDANDSCIAATLFQFDTVKNARVPIAFFSKNLKNPQINYSIFDKEILAIYLSIKHFRYMLEGRHFKILCDNKAAVQSITKKDSSNFSARVLRHLQYISQFSTDCEYIASEKNFVADALTRANVSLISDLPFAINYEEIADTQRSDSEIQAMTKQISSLQLQRLPLSNNKTILCDVSQNAPRVLLPRKYRQKAFENIHSLNHPGIKSTKYMIKQKFIWPGMNKDIQTWVQQCKNCQSVKTQQHTRTAIKSYPPPTQAFEELNLDLIGPLPPARGYRHILTITDRFTKGCFAIAVPDTKSDTIATYFMNQYVSLFGVPRTIVTDNAAYFTSYSWSKFMNFLNVQHKFITAYHSQSNGMVERFNRFLRTALRCQDKSDAWFDHLGLALLGINASYNSDIGMSRAERLFGKKLRLPGVYFDESASQPAFDDPSMLKRLMDFFNNRDPAPINTHGSKKKVHVDKQLQTCSAVYIRVDRVKKGLEPSYTGPFKVIHKSDKYFTVSTFHGSKNVSLDRLKPAYVAEVFDTVDCNSTKTNQSSFLDKSALRNNSSTGTSSRSEHRTDRDEQSLSSATHTTPQQHPKLLFTSGKFSAV